MRMRMRRRRRRRRMRCNVLEVKARRRRRRRRRKSVGNREGEDKRTESSLTVKERGGLKEERKGFANRLLQYQW